MKLNDIADMDIFLNERCYCPFEIYDISGFFFQEFTPDTECKLIAEGTRNSLHGKFVIAKAGDEYQPQIIYIEITNDKVDSCTRFDATENNIREVVEFMAGTNDKLHLDEFPETDTAKKLDEIFSVADAIISIT